MKKVVVWASTVFSKMLYYDAARQQDFTIACFAVEQEYLKGRSELLGLPLVALEKIPELYPPREYDMIVLFTGLNHIQEREEKYLRAKRLGYALRNYVSPWVDIAPDVAMGENNIILGQTHIGLGGIMGDNNLIRQQVYLGHDFRLGSHIEITAGCNIGGNTEIKNNCYIGLGTTIINAAKIAQGNFIGAGSTIIRDTEPNSKNIGSPSRIIGYFS